MTPGDTMHVTMPVMRGVAAIVVEPTEFLLPPKAGEMFVAIGAGADPQRADAGMLYIGIQGATGGLLTAIIPEQQLTALGKLLSDAADRIRRLDFEKVEAGHG